MFWSRLIGKSFIVDIRGGFRCAPTGGQWDGGAAEELTRNGGYCGNGWGCLFGFLSVGPQLEAHGYVWGGVPICRRSCQLLIKPWLVEADYCRGCYVASWMGW